MVYKEGFCMTMAQPITKKITYVLMAAVIALLGMFSATPSAEAATGSAGACGVTVWTDATTYSSSATTVDWRAYGSNCGTKYYVAQVYEIRSDGQPYAIGVLSTGYFASSSPEKSFSISTIKSKDTGSTNRYQIIVDLYANPEMSSFHGVAKSVVFTLN